MNEHDLLSGTEPIQCACGRTWPELSTDQARKAHESHYHVERARAALRGVKETDE